MMDHNYCGIRIVGYSIIIAKIEHDYFILFKDYFAIKFQALYLCEITLFIYNFVFWMNNQRSVL